MQQLNLLSLTKKREKHAVMMEAALCSLLLMIFSFFVLYDFPLKLISLAALVTTSYFISRNLQPFNFAFTKPGISIFSLSFNISGIILGILLAIFYRWYLGISLLPYSIHYFVIIAAFTGATEELVFRGWLQDKVKSISGPFSIFFSTVSHTAYKCCLFLSPAAIAGIDVTNLAFWTFLFGLLCGTIKHFSKSIMPTLLAHAIFDILVYAEFVKAPWWVW